MKQNKYDDPSFFSEYAKMPRSLDGLEAAGEWHALREVLPDLNEKTVLDLGCGYGWHCRYAAEQGAKSVLGIDLSGKMLERARELTENSNIRYQQTAIEDFAAPKGSFQVVLSSLALHYVEDLGPVFKKVHELLDSNGIFCYSTEHPIFTSRSEQDWVYDESGTPLYWPVDGYFRTGKRDTNFLGASVTKYHRTIQNHFEALRQNGFEVDRLVEPLAPPQMIDERGWQNEYRRPMMLILRAARVNMAGSERK